MIVNYSTANRRRGGVVAGLGRGPPMGIEYNHFRQPADPTPGGMYWDRAISSSSATQEQEKAFVGATSPSAPQRFTIYDFRDFGYANNYSFAVYRFRILKRWHAQARCLCTAFEREEDQRAVLVGFSCEVQTSTSSARHPPLERQPIDIRIASFARSRQLTRLEKVRSTPRGGRGRIWPWPPMGIEYNHFRQPADPTPGGDVLGPSKEAL